MLSTLTSNLKGSSDLSLAAKVAVITLIIKIPLVMVGDYVVNYVGLNGGLFLSDQQIPDISAFDLILVVTIAPIVETLIGQTIPIKVGGKFTSDKNKLIIFSAFVFSLLHVPVVGFLVSAFAIGLVFSWAYISKGSGKNAFKVVALSHSIHNAIAFVSAYLLATVWG